MIARLITDPSRRSSSVHRRGPEGWSITGGRCDEFHGTRHRHGRGRCRGPDSITDVCGKRIATGWDVRDTVSVVSRGYVISTHAHDLLLSISLADRMSERRLEPMRLSQPAFGCPESADSCHVRDG